MVCTPVPGIAKLIVSVPPAALAAVIASRREQSASHVPSFVSAILVTVKVAAEAEFGVKAITINITKSNGKDTVCTKFFTSTDNLIPCYYNISIGENIQQNLH